MNPSTRDTTRLSRISEAERRAILDRLDQQDAKNPARNKRTGTRVIFRKNDIAIRVFHPGGSTTSCFVTTRNLSNGGASILYEGFLHKATRIEMVLKRRLGGDDIIRGSVQHCQLITRNAHLVGVKFESAIFPKMYLDPAEWGELDDGAQVDRSKLTGTVLHLDDQELDRMLMVHFLKGTQIKLISVATVDEAALKLKENQFDVLLCDLALGECDGQKAIERLRAEGFVGPVGLVTAETSPARIKAVQDAGASAVLTKPYDAARLTSLLASWLNSGSDTSEAPVFSTLANNDATQELVQQYVTKLRTLARELRKAIKANNGEGVRNICQVIKGTGSGFGFATISDLAREAVQCLDAGSSINESSAQLQQLESACLRASSSPSTKAA